MRSESEIRVMMGHVHGLVRKYQTIKEQAAASGDQEAERQDGERFSDHKRRAWASEQAKQR